MFDIAEASRTQAEEMQSDDENSKPSDDEASKLAEHAGDDPLDNDKSSTLPGN